jgi:hypothetical protein
VYVEVGADPVNVRVARVVGGRAVGLGVRRAFGLWGTSRNDTGERCRVAAWVTRGGGRPSAWSLESMINTTMLTTA